MVPPALLVAVFGAATALLAAAGCGSAEPPDRQVVVPAPAPLDLPDHSMDGSSLVPFGDGAAYRIEPEVAAGGRIGDRRFQVETSRVTSSRGDVECFTLRVGNSAGTSCGDPGDNGLAPGSMAGVWHTSRVPDDTTDVIFTLSSGRRVVTAALVLNGAVGGRYVVALLPERAEVVKIEALNRKGDVIESVNP